MNFVKSEVGSVGCVGGMTRCTIDLGQSKSLVLRDQASVFQVVATGAQDPGLIPESHSGVAAVRVVTFQTFALGKRLVHKRAFLLRFNILVARPADLAGGSGQEIWPS
jgi:ABC-type taurine transport system substrate-binding protein